MFNAHSIQHKRSNILGIIIQFVCVPGVYIPNETLISNRVRLWAPSRLCSSSTHIIPLFPKIIRARDQNLPHWDSRQSWSYWFSSRDYSLHSSQPNHLSSTLICLLVISLFSSADCTVCKSATKIQFPCPNNRIMILLYFYKKRKRKKKTYLRYGCLTCDINIGVSQLAEYKKRTIGMLRGSHLEHDYIAFEIIYGD